MSTVGSLTLTAQEQPGVVAYDCARLDSPTGQAQKDRQPTWLVWYLARLVQCGFREQFRRCSILLKVVGTHGGKVPCGAGHHRAPTAAHLCKNSTNEVAGFKIVVPFISQ